MYQGSEAVIEKDNSACKLALETQADTLMILTDVAHVFINYGTPEQAGLTSVSPQQLKQHIEEGQFSPGSMLPKVQAAIRFAEAGGRAIICSLDRSEERRVGKE